MSNCVNECQIKSKPNNTNNTKYRWVFSLNIRVLLREKGIEPILEKNNMKNPKYKCWKYVADSAFQEAFDEILEGRE